MEKKNYIVFQEEKDNCTLGTAIFDKASWTKAYNELRFQHRRELDRYTKNLKELYRIKEELGL